MNKTLIRIMVILTAIICMAAFFACDPPVEEGDKSITVIILKSDHTADIYQENTDALYLGKALDEMIEEGDITVEYSMFGKDRFITAIGGLEPQASSWIGIYTDDEKDPLLINKEFTVTFEGKTYYSTNYGIDDMPLHDGTAYLFTISE